MKERNNIDWEALSKGAWKVRENANILGNTKVGAALITTTGIIFTGCNIEQLYRNKDIHAEVCAISNMVSNGENCFLAILIVAERERFTPCGTCMDWIFQFGGENALVAYQKEVGGKVNVFYAKELMPFYPK